MSRIDAAQDVVERALALSRTDGCVVIADEASSANLRWANNTLTTNGVTRSRRLTVIATLGGASGTSVGVVARSAVDLAEVEGLVRSAEEAARQSVAAEDAQPLVDPDRPAPGSKAPGWEAPGWEAPPRETSIGVFADLAPALGDAFGRARAEERLLFGYAHHQVCSTYLASTTGLRLRHDQPTGHVEMNAKSPDYLRSAWIGRSSADFSDVDLPTLERELAQRMRWAERSRSLGAGRYEALLPPSTVADLMISLYWSAGGRDAQDGRTVFSRAAGGTRVGDRLAALPLTLRSDPFAAGLECAPFVIARSSGSTQSVFDNGMPVGQTRWISDGVLSSLLHTRHSAELSGSAATPEADNLILEGDGSGRSLEEMVAGTDRGLLLTCIWYVREVDPQTLLLTGLTRDGVYAVEHGEVVGAVNNFRFNESPVALLGRVSEVGRTEHTLAREWCDYFTRTAMPSLRVPDFNMSSVSQAS